MMKLPFAILFVLPFCFAVAGTLGKSGPERKGSLMVVVPGKSLGIVAIGESRKSLELKGFVIEESRADKRYLKRENLLALLEQDKVVQIWFEKIDLEELRLNGKHPPKKTDAASLAQFFAPCDQPTVGSGGKLIYCSNRGIELAYDHADKFLGLSVLSIK